ncbi:MAG: DNA-3-methyladenine glycosylase 2 family protein [Alphaproteobacteria bacterium]
MTAVRALTPQRFRHAIWELSARDRDLARICEEHGAPVLRTRPSGFPALLRIIVEQQLSVASARAIWGRLEGMLGEVTPARLVGFDDVRLRSAGLSRPKVLYARGLADAVMSGDLDSGRLAELDDEAAIEALVRVKGIGRWTAEIYLLSALGRPDVWPVDDLAIATATGRVKGLAERPARAELLEIGEAWRPWRSVAARMLWHYFRSAVMKPGTGAYDAQPKATSTRTPGRATPRKRVPTAKGARLRMRPAARRKRTKSGGNAKLGKNRR